MKRYLLMMMFASVLVLSACGGTNKASSNGEETEEKNIVYKNYSIKNVDYEVPENWREEVSDENLTYYYPEGGMLMVSYADMNESLSSKEVRTEFIEAFASVYESYELKGQSEVKVADTTAYEFYLNVVSEEGENYEIDLVTFDANDGIMAFVMYTLKESGKDFNNEFKNIISSIKIEVQETENEADEGTDSNEIVLGEPIELGDYVLTIQKYILGKDYEGKDALIINYDWENKSVESTAPFMTFRMKGFQDNIETDDAIMVEGVDLAIGQKEVRPEGKIENAQTTVGISDMDAPLELELTELFSFGDESYIAELDLSTLK